MLSDLADGAVESSGADDWISISRASQMLGVSQPTLRRWSDEGRVPSVRTLGGHRRYARQAIQSLQQRADQVGVTTETALSLPEPLDRQRLSDQDWHQRLALGSMTESTLSRMRALGQRLLGLMLQHVHSRTSESRYLAEATTVGKAYGAEAARAGVSLPDTAQAFVYFRRACARMTAPAPVTLSTLAETAALHERIEVFMDAILLGALAGYEGAMTKYATDTPHVDPR